MASCPLLIYLLAAWLCSLSPVTGHKSFLRGILTWAPWGSNVWKWAEGRKLKWFTKTSLLLSRGDAGASLQANFNCSVSDRLTKKKTVNTVAGVIVSKNIWVHLFWKAQIIQWQNPHSGEETFPQGSPKLFYTVAEFGVLNWKYFTASKMYGHKNVCSSFVHPSIGLIYDEELELSS